MRGDDELQIGMFSYVTVEQRIAGDPDACRSGIASDGGGVVEAVFDHRRPSIAPERLLRAQLLMVLYSIRSERLLMAQLNYNLLFR
jgi:hypothetical protein